MKIRNAVGAVVFQNNEYLLVHKVKSIDVETDANGHWDLPKGGIQESDESLEAAILRELKEETGSTKYRIICRFDRKIYFSFSNTHKYDRQETDMFYVEYFGNREDLKSLDEEIDKVKFFRKNEVMSILCFEETREFFYHLRSIL